VLGLGDTNYDKFNAAATKVDSYLQKLGSKRFYPTGLADDGTGTYYEYLTHEHYRRQDH
jgi:sulfite reductase alpha subunit-like flavoprotein